MGQENTLDGDFERILRMVPGNETGYDTFNIHDYPAKFMPQYPEIFIRHYSEEHQLVVDPMCGSGTTLIAACLQNRRAYGVDIDPVASLIASVAITPLNPEALSDYRQRLNRHITQVFKQKRQERIDLPTDEEYPNALLWFRPEVLRELLVIRDVILKTDAEAPYRNFALLCLSSIVRQVSNADPRDIFPERDAAVPVRERKDVHAHFQRALFDNAKRVVAFSENVGYETRVRVVQGDARHLEIEDASVDLVFTSPPYCYAMDYARVHQLSTLLFIMDNRALREHRRRYIGTDRVTRNGQLDSFDGFSFAEEQIHDVYAQDKKYGVILYQYFSDMHKVTLEAFRILKRGGHLIYVIGNSTVKRTEFRTDRVLTEICRGAGFEIERTLERPYYAYRMMRKRNVQSNTIKADIFIVARKP
jgi:DNA modification methylase